MLTAGVATQVARQLTTFDQCWLNRNSGKFFCLGDGNDAVPFDGSTRGVALLNKDSTPDHGNGRLFGSRNNGYGSTFPVRLESLMFTCSGSHE